MGPAADDAHVGSTTIPPSLRSDLNGLVGGLQLGRNWQLGTVVVGIEADFAGSAIGDSTTGQRITLGVPILTRLEREVDWLSTVRGRIGALPTANLLVFATGGLAFGRVEQRLSLDGGGIGFLGAGAGGLSCPAGGALCLAGSSSDISVGWTAGAGFEYAITPQISLKGEYLFADLGEYAVTATPTAAALATPGVFLRSSSEVELHIVRAGVNVKF